MLVSISIVSFVFADIILGKTEKWIVEKWSKGWVKKAKSAHEPSGPHCWSLSRFLQHEVTRSIGHHSYRGFNKV